MSDKLIKDILAKYDEDFASNTWLVPGGKARAIMHKCIERMAAKAGIIFDNPTIVDADPSNVVIIVEGWMGDRKNNTWSFGEASPKNNKNAYPYSMAEKRAKDRVALKLIGLHGLLYSEEEADDLKEPAVQAPPPKEPTSEEFDTFTTIKNFLENATSATQIDAILRAEASQIASLPEPLKVRLREVVRFVREARKVAA